MMAITFHGVRKWCVILSMGLSTFVVLWCQLKNLPVQEGVKDILSGMNALTLAVYGTSKTIERVTAAKKEGEEK